MIMHIKKLSFVYKEADGQERNWQYNSCLEEIFFDFTGCCKHPAFLNESKSSDIKFRICFSRIPENSFIKKNSISNSHFSFNTFQFLFKHINVPLLIKHKEPILYGISIKRRIIVFNIFSQQNLFLKTANKFDNLTIQPRKFSTHLNMSIPKTLVLLMQGQHTKV